MTQATAQPAAAVRERKLTRTLIGTVISDKRSKTRTVAVDYSVRHTKYGKYLHRTTKYQVHDPDNACRRGDKVEIANCRPISKTKSWRLVRVVQAAAVIDVVQVDAAGNTAQTPSN